jgi:hypothetical protein
MLSGRQFEYEVVLNSKLDSNSVIPNWIGSPMYISLALQHLLDVPFVLHGLFLDS